MPEDEVGETPAPPPQEDPPEEQPPEEEPADEPVDEPEDDELLACSFDEIGEILTCAVEECLIGDFDPSDPSAFDPAAGGFDVAELLVCAGISCLPVILGLSPECADCILTGVSGGTDELLEACVGDLGGLGGGLPGGGGLPF